MKTLIVLLLLALSLQAQIFADILYRCSLNSKVVYLHIGEFPEIGILNDIIIAKVLKDYNVYAGVDSNGNFIGVVIDVYENTVTVDEVVYQCKEIE